MNLLEVFGTALLSLVVLVGVSFVVEACRRAPKPPEELAWAPAVPVQYVDISGVRIRYIKAGAGDNLVLLHTLRTQLDLYEKVVPSLAKQFTIYAFDYPGHGFSDIPEAQYDADYFVGFVESFLRALDLRNVTLCGVSIGGSISLIVAGRRNPRIARVVAINPYDYAKGRGMGRSSVLGWLITFTAGIPVLGGTIMRLRNFAIMNAVLRGGVADPGSLSDELAKEMYEVGNRRGHYRAFLSLLRNAASWEAARESYRDILVPVNIIWGQKDWSTLAEREQDRSLIPRAQMTTVENGGHFLPLDRPEELQELITRFRAASTQPKELVLNNESQRTLPMEE
jgi:pimeloyl-ACP methyl ester carboxylesterase